MKVVLSLVDTDHPWEPPVEGLPPRVKGSFPFLFFRSTESFSSEFISREGLTKASPFTEKIDFLDWPSLSPSPPSPLDRWILSKLFPSSSNMATDENVFFRPGFQIP